MSAESEGLLADLRLEGAFDSQGEFQVDLTRAREKLEQHLGLWPEDYLAFLIQAACGLKATRMRLRAGWRRVIWEFDGQALSKVQLQSLIDNNPTDVPLQRLQFALFLLSRSRYSSVRLESGLTAPGHRMLSQGGRSRLLEIAPLEGCSTRLELELPMRELSIHWLVTRPSVLRRLPEVASLGKRMVASPLRLEGPWSRLQRPATGKAVGWALRLVGRTALPEVSPLPTCEVVERHLDCDFSLWFFPDQRSHEIQCFLWGLGYSGPAWAAGCLWIYDNRFKTDLTQRQIVAGPQFEQLLDQVRAQLDPVLGELLADPGRLDVAWIQRLLRRPEHGLKFMEQLPLFPTWNGGLLSLQDLRRLHRGMGRLFYSDLSLGAIPEEAPPILRPEGLQSLLPRDLILAPAAPMVEVLRKRQIRRQEWQGRAQESLELENASYKKDLAEAFPDSGWKGQVGMLGVESPPRIDVFMDSRWIASVPMSSAFPLGFIGRVEHADLELDEAWSKLVGPLWHGLIDELQKLMPTWMAQWCGQARHPEDRHWLDYRAYRMLMSHEQPGPLEECPLVPFGSQRRSLQDLRREFRAEQWNRWPFEGFSLSEASFKLVVRLAEDTEAARQGRLQLQGFGAGFNRWKASSDQGPALPTTLDYLCRVAISGPGELRGEVAFTVDKVSGITVVGFREGKKLANSQISLPGFPEGLVAAVDHPELLPNLDWSGLDMRCPAWIELMEALQHCLPRLLRALFEGTHPWRSLGLLRLLRWCPELLPKKRRQVPSGGAPFCWRLDGSAVGSVEVWEMLQGQRVPRYLALELAPVLLEGFADCWLLDQDLAAEIRMLGPSRLNDCGLEYQAARQGRARMEAVLVGHWIHKESLKRDAYHGEVGLREAAGTTCNRVGVKLVSAGYLMLERELELGPSGRWTSPYRLEAVIDLGSLKPVAELVELEPSVIQGWKECFRRFGLSHAAIPRDYQWERLYWERDGLDTVSEEWRALPLFSMNGSLLSWAELRQHVEKTVALDYSISATPLDEVLNLEVRELPWLKRLFPDGLRDCTHLLKSVSPAAPGAELPLADLDYLATGQSPGLRWGLCRQLHEASEIRVWKRGQLSRVLSFDWRYQVRASLEPTALHSEEVLLERLRAEVERAILEQTEESYRLKVALATWGLVDDWALQLQAQPLLEDPREQRYSVKQWCSHWSELEALPYLKQRPTSPEGEAFLALLPGGPVPVLSQSTAQVAARVLPLHEYSEGLRQAWNWSRHPVELPTGARSFSERSGMVLVSADPLQTSRTLRVLWRGRVIHLEHREGWPGYCLEVDWSQLPLDRPWPRWSDLDSCLSGYRRFLHELLHRDEHLQPYREAWEALPVAASPGPLEHYYDPTEEDLRTLLSRRKAGWVSVDQHRFRPVVALWEGVFGARVTIDFETGSAPLRQVQEGDGIRLFLNPEHRWLRGASPERIALRLSLYAQVLFDGERRQAVASVLQVLEEIGLIEKSERMTDQAAEGDPHV